MQTKIVRLHSARRNPASSEIRELRQQLARQDALIAELAADLITLQESQRPAPWGFDHRDEVAP